MAGAAQAQFVWPMNALLVERVPADGDWLYEIKWDGYRVLAVKTRAETELFSRRARLVTGQFPEVAQAVARLPGKSFVFDGEVVALDERGRASFQLLQNLASARRPSLHYYVFDVLSYEGRDFMPLPLAERKAFLGKVLRRVRDPIRFSASLIGDPHDLLELARQQGIEGLIGKRADSPYEPGRRSGAWIKLKVTREQEFVIGGYTQPQGSRPYFGALLVGYYERDQLMFAARVGTGFNTKTLASLYQTFQKLRTDHVPFANVPTRRAGKHGGGLTHADMKRCVWIRPERVAQVKFTEWTQDGGVRHPVFLGLRDDKSAREVVREPSA